MRRLLVLLAADALGFGWMPTDAQAGTTVAPVCGRTVTVRLTPID